MPKDKTRARATNTTRELTPQQAREKRLYMLAAMAAQEHSWASDEDERETNDASDASMATLILPGGD